MKRTQLIIFLLFPLFAWTQSRPMATISGVVNFQPEQPAHGAGVSIFGIPIGTTTNEKGEYKLKVPADTVLQIVVNLLGYETIKQDIQLKVAEHKEINFELLPSLFKITQYTVKSEKDRDVTMEHIDPILVNKVPSINGNVEDIIKTLPGVSSQNELSAQYNVRGGNFDENLIYVNGIEIYRPMLVESGKQEGLSFINSDLVSDVNFSAGGFSAEYGDKMSSVLAVKYKKPTKFKGSGTFTLQGGNVHVEGSAVAHRFTYLLGARYKSNQYILNSLETKGSYKPRFMDFQSYLTYDVTQKIEVAFLGYASNNVYRFIPEDRETSFGTINNAKQLKIYFDGQEKDVFNSYFGAFSGIWRPDKKNKVQLNIASYQSLENENYDIEGAYLINQLENDLGSDNFGEVAYNVGIGSYMRHARDYLNTTVSNIQLKGTSHLGKHKLDYGVKLQQENFDAQLSEWYLVDSAGFSTPHPTDSVGYTNPNVQKHQSINLNDVFKTSHQLTSQRLMGYVQDRYKFQMRDSSRFILTYGVRANYLDLNKQTVISPRASIALKPNWKHEWMFHFSTGYYYQPPFYKELIDLDGNVHKDVKAQRAIHFVLGGKHDFKAWGRPFKVTAAAYYKKLDFLNPYKIRNVRIRYLGENIAKGYAAGVDARVAGQFVKGINSWLSLSFLQTKENLFNDSYTDYYNSDGEKIIPGYTINNSPTDSTVHHPGYIPRPSDHLVNAALYFQDYLPGLPSLQMHLTLFFSSPLPFGPPDSPRYADTLRMPPYQRVDIGFSYEILGEHHKWKKSSRNPFRYFDKIWASVEIFNLLQINNTISYIWISDVNGRQYAIPNHLTARQLNVKLHFEF